MRTALGLTLLFSLQQTSKAQVNNYNLFKEDFLDQTGPTTVTSSTWSFSSLVNLDSTGDATAASITSPDSTVHDMVLTGTNPVTYQYEAPFTTKTDLDAAFPSGATYVDSISGGTLGSDSGNITVPSETTLPFPSAIPSFSDYTALQDIDTTKSFDFTFSGFNDVTSGSINSFIFLDVDDLTTGNDVFSQGFISATTNGAPTDSIVMPANTLNPDDSYSATLVYDDRTQTTDDGFAASSGGMDPFVGFDYSTTADFTTLAVPEPSTWWMLFGGLGFLALRRKFASRS